MATITRSAPTLLLSEQWASYSREFKAGVVLEFRRMGHSFEWIAETCGISPKDAYKLAWDPDGSKKRAHNQKYRGVCIDCGGATARTSSGNGGIGPAKRCLPCYRLARSSAWTAEALIERIRAWNTTYGSPPLAMDWDPYSARSKGMEEAAERFHRDGCWPPAKKVRLAFGSWHAGILAAGLIPQRRSRGPRGGVGAIPPPTPGWKDFKRDQKVGRIRELRELGYSYDEIAESLGISRSAANNLVIDPDLSKQRARRERYAGTCLGCGARTDGSRGPGKAPAYCVHCQPGCAAIWTRDAIIERIRAWNETYGSPPTAQFWNPTMARANGRHDIADRWEIDGCWPQTGTVQMVFGTWNAGILASGFWPRKPGGRGAGNPPAVALLAEDA